MIFPRSGTKFGRQHGGWGPRRPVWRHRAPWRCRDPGLPQLHLQGKGGGVVVEQCTVAVKVPKKPHTSQTKTVLEGLTAVMELTREICAPKRPQLPRSNAPPTPPP